MIAVDASVLIAQLDVRDGFHERAKAALGEVAEDPLVASAITIAEVLVGPATHGAAARVRADIRRLGVEEAPLGPDAALRLAELRASTRLKLPDCCVLLAAETAEARGVLTFDERLGAAARAAGFTTP